MKVIIGLGSLLLITFSSIAQNYNGQWKGGFQDNTSVFGGLGASRIDYVLELECVKKVVTGYSYTYFSDGGKQYYTICRLTGSLNRKTKEIMVTEVERTKSNTPPDFRNCFQTHLLKYSKLNSDTEQLIGNWIPAPNQAGDCGKGLTYLYRKTIKKIKNADLAIKPQAKVKLPLPFPNKKVTPANSTARKTTKPPVSPSRSYAATPEKTKKVDLKNKRYEDSVKERSMTIPPRTYKEEPMAAQGDYKMRVKSLIKTIDIHQETITVDFYDNGAVDGDSITVFFNGKVVVTHLGLTEKPATFTLVIDKSLPYNELVMYAENMGTIPPNTALMVVKDGARQYEVNITSDTERSGTIRFHYAGNP